MTVSNIVWEALYRSQYLVWASVPRLLWLVTHGFIDAPGIAWNGQLDRSLEYGTVGAWMGPGIELISWSIAMSTVLRGCLASCANHYQCTAMRVSNL